MDIKIRVTQAYDEFYRLSMHVRGRTGVYKFLIPAAYLLSVFIMTIYVILNFIDGISSSDILITFLLVALTIVFVYVEYVLPHRMMRKEHLLYVNVVGERTYHFTEERVAYKDQINDTRIPWGKFTSWSEDDKILVLFLGHTAGAVIPKRCLSLKQAADIRQTILNVGIPAYKVRHVGIIVLFALLLFFFTPLVCLWAFLTLLSLI
jgi:hypothetical protein